MPSLIDLRRRIRSVKNTQQITSAMKMVSAAKLRRAQESALSARPYSTLLKEMMASILGKAAEDSPVRTHAFFEQREEKRSLVLLLTGDRGLCGAFNSNAIRASQGFVSDHQNLQIEFEMVGRKGADYYRRRDVAVAGEWTNVFKAVNLATAQKIAGKVTERFTNAEIDSVYLIYNRFKSVVQQEIALDRLLPMEAETSDAGSVDYIYEQPPEDVFGTLVPKLVETQIFQALLESAAAEHAARMTAMDSATKNAEEMLEKLTLHLNRVRQASITTEIIEIVSGAQALEEISG